MVHDDDTAEVTRYAIPADLDARKRWAELFTEELLDHPHDDFSVWVRREQGKNIPLV